MTTTRIEPLRWSFIVLAIAAVLVLGTGHVAEAQRSRPARCQGGFYLIEGDPLVPGGTAPDSLVVDRGNVSTLSGCPSARAKVFKRKGRKAESPDELLVKWPACGTLARVNLRAQISADCATVSGKFKVKGVRGRKFTARDGVPEGLRPPWGPGPLPPGAVYVTPAEFIDASTQPGFRLITPTQAADDEAAAAAADAADQATLDAFVAAHPERADYVSIGVDPNDPDLQPTADGNYQLVIFDNDGNGQYVITQGPRYQRAVRAETIRTFPTQENQLAVYRQLYAFAHEHLDPTLPAPEELAGQSAKGLAALNRSIADQSAAAGEASLLPGEVLPESFPSRCTNEIGSSGGDGSRHCEHRPHGLWETATWPLKYFDTCVKQQGLRGTCVSFAVSAGRELRAARRYNRWLNLSEQHLYFMAKRIFQPAEFGDGLNPTTLLRQIFSADYQQPLDQNWDYNPSNSRTQDAANMTYASSCVDYVGPDQAFCSDTSHQGPTLCMQQGANVVCAVTAPPLGATAVRTTDQPAELWDAENPTNGLRNIIVTLLDHVPLVIGLDVVQSFDTPDQNGFVRYQADRSKICETKPVDPAVPAVTECVPADDCECSRGGHAVLAVGFIPEFKLPEGTPDSTGGFFIIKNSWGCVADGGYYYLPASWVRSFIHSAHPVGEVEVVGPLPDQPTDSFRFDFTPVPPSIRIVQPLIGESYVAGQGIPLVLEGVDYQYDQWALLGPVRWTSSILGEVGLGQSTVTTLTEGTHFLTATYTGKLGEKVTKTTTVVVGAQPDDLPPTPLFSSYSLLAPEQCPASCQGDNHTCIVGFGEGSDPEDGALRDDAHVRWYMQIGNANPRELGSTGASVGGQGKFIGCPILCGRVFRFILEVEDSRGQRTEFRRELATQECVN